MSDKMVKTEPKKSRRTLKNIDNKVPIQPLKKQNSKSMKRTERSISMSRDKSIDKISSHEKSKALGPMTRNNSNHGKLNYKISCYSSRNMAKDENEHNKLV